MKQNQTIDIINLDVEIEYNFNSPSIGGTHEDGSQEEIPATVDIYSVKAQGFEIISLIHPDQKEALEEEMLKDFGY